jgi:hypothetical protein
MVILHFLATVLWIGMLLGFLFAVFWVIVTVVLIRGYKRWVHGDETNQANSISEQDLLDDA